MSEYVIRRVSIYRYQKSGKIAGIYRNLKYSNMVVLELAPDLSAIAKVRMPKYVNQKSVAATGNQLEVAVSEQAVGKGQFSIHHRFVRILTTEDMDIERWKNTAELSELPVTSEPELTIEERVWSGEVSGNIGVGILLSVVTLGFLYLSVQSLMNLSWATVLTVPVATLLSWQVCKFDWQAPKPPQPSKVKELQTYKEQLQTNQRARLNAAKTKLQSALQDYRNWARLTPQQFESTISMRLKDEGFEVETTQFSNDGGIDIEAVDPAGSPAIVQAKKYTGHVGVAVVREMIGIRQTRSDHPRTIIFSLAGYTRGAKELASEQNIELRDIKSELMKI